MILFVRTPYLPVRALIPMIKYPTTPLVRPTGLPFSPYIKAGPFVFVSGQASVDASGAIVADTFEGEMRRAIANMSLVLRAAGSSISHVVQTRNYLQDPRDWQEFNRIYEELFSAPYPARTTLSHCIGDALKFEIECVALEIGSQLTIGN
jgi:2-iminobutanoate/2-iminopropanoate deaminase